MARTELPAGQVAFNVSNRGPSTHEFLIVRTDLRADNLPIGSDGLTVNEDSAQLDLIEEDSELDIGVSRTLVVDLPAITSSTAISRVTIWEACTLPWSSPRAGEPMSDYVAQRPPRWIRLGHGRRAPTVGQLGSERRLVWTVAAYLLVIAAILAYNATATGSERDSALVVNVAARQRAVAERYIKDVLLRLYGYEANPEEDARTLQVNARALLEGGTVQAVQGADAQVHIPPASSDPKVIAKLEQEGRLIDKLIATGNSLLGSDPMAADLEGRVLKLRIIGAQVSTITNDAVGQMTF